MPVLPTSAPVGTNASTTGPTAPGAFNSAIPAPGTPEGLTDTNEKSFWDQDYMSGEWGGLRKKLEDDGFKITPTWIGDFFGNPTGGAAQGIEENGSFDVALDFDLDRMSEGAVKDLSIHANAFYIYGPGLSPKYVGDFSNTSNIQGYNTIRLQELWIQKWLWDKRVSIKVGNLAVDSEYFQSTSAAVFINSTFGTPDLIANNIANAPIFPVASPGVRIQFLPTSKYYVMAGVYGMDLNSTPATDNHYGTHFAMNGGSGLLVMSEAGFLLNQSPNDRGLQGTYRLGSFVETDNYNNWGSQAASALGTGSLQSAGANFGIYGVIDQQIYSEDDKTISLFVRGGGAPSNINFVDAYIDGGFNFTGFVPGRANDVAGIGLAHAHVSGNFSNGQVIQGNAPYTEESVLEVTYKAQLNSWWTVQPDFQYVMNPSGVAGSPNAVVLGVRSSVAF
jgi:porin